MTSESNRNLKNERAFERLVRFLGKWLAVIVGGWLIWHYATEDVQWMQSVAKWANNHETLWGVMVVVGICFITMVGLGLAFWWWVTRNAAPMPEWMEKADEELRYGRRGIDRPPTGESPAPYYRGKRTTKMRQ